MRTARPLAVLAIATAILTLTACAGASAPAGQSADVSACQHYYAQKAAYAKNATIPGVLTLDSGVTADAALADGSLKTDLLAFHDVIQAEFAGHSADGRAVVQKIEAACTALGVKP
jgi:hypothetical protein